MIYCLCKENVQDGITSEEYVAGKKYPFTKERAEEVTTKHNGRYFVYAEAIVEQVEEEKVSNEEVVDETNTIEDTEETTDEEAVENATEQEEVETTKRTRKSTK